MAPINPGWSWGVNGWTYNNEIDDNRDPLTRTSEEIKKTLEFTVDFLKFTTESEKDFVSGFLPSLDAQTQVQENGKVLFKFFRKPMANNVVIQFGTGLPKNVIFSALRQDLVRRMLNCSSDLPWGERLKVIEDYIQLMVNSNHSFPFIKAIVLQALTKYKSMVQRSKLKETDTKFMPLHRSRTFKMRERLILKYIEKTTWYTGLNLGDQFRNSWKSRIRGVALDLRGCLRDLIRL